ncbi:hypothetical protein IQ215_11605 [Cyanobacterium stanieri LEGE 03274]|uniref:DUF7734 domain-containing protein n=1 Tax=Cyanobacterium stanieri LEGE 03274 TaxID=1828756 RepID=A0ABR9V624_9CHRO|nr:hypothetical protein [Cyanobacterium stanieri]MBE9223343.1 hypothetical protein [Cyanobacterium stanieri LEGE 03274]
MNNLLLKIEEYTKENPQWLVIVKAEENGQNLEIMTFRGFSSSLTGATEYDPDLPVLSSSGIILSVDLLQAPYNPVNPLYIEQNLTPAQFEANFLS